MFLHSSLASLSDTTISTTVVCLNYRLCNNTSRKARSECEFIYYTPLESDTELDKDDCIRWRIEEVGVKRISLINPGTKMTDGNVKPSESGEVNNSYCENTEAEKRIGYSERVWGTVNYAQKAESVNESRLPEKTKKDL